MQITLQTSTLMQFIDLRRTNTLHSQRINAKKQPIEDDYISPQINEKYP